MAAYAFDFALYGVAVLALAVGLSWLAPFAEWPRWLGLALSGWGIWTLLEYAVHRFVLHRLPPFKRWHFEHHHRPAALICAPTVLSVGLAYAVLHHATHHWRARGAWLKRRKLWHAQHHRVQRGSHPAGADISNGKSAYFGVSSGFWDHVFHTAQPVRAHALRHQPAAPTKRSDPDTACRLTDRGPANI